LLNHIENEDWLHFKPSIPFYFKPANSVHLNNTLRQLCNYIAEMWLINFSCVDANFNSHNYIHIKKYSTF